MAASVSISSFGKCTGRRKESTVIMPMVRSFTRSGYWTIDLISKVSIHHLSSNGDEWRVLGDDRLLHRRHGLEQLP